MMNRNIQPTIVPVEELSILKPLIFDVTKDVRLLWMKAVPNDTVRLDLYFHAGITSGTESIPAIVHSLLLSGTATKTSLEINEEIDRLGGYIDTDISFETSVISIYALKEFILPIAHIVANAINGLNFEASELADTVRSLKQSFQENQQKVRYLAQQQFRKGLFASNEMYAQLANMSHFDNVNERVLKHYFQQNYLNGLTRMTLVGDLEQDQVDELIDLFGKWAVDVIPTPGSNFIPLAENVHVPFEGAVQSAIRLGKFLVPKNHPDYFDLQLLNTILGDYFGSRLMSNIREDKGYTYGIGSAIMDIRSTSYFVIMTEVGVEVRDAALAEIKLEIERLQTELVEEQELTLVKNYVSGQLLKSADGPYALLDLYNSVDLYGVSISYYEEALARIQKITPQRLKDLAVQYLKWEDFFIVTAG